MVMWLGNGILGMCVTVLGGGGVSGHATGGTGYASYLSGGSRPSGSGSSKFGGSDGCPRCGKPVYMAEKIVGAGKVSELVFSINMI